MTKRDKRAECAADVTGAVRAHGSRRLGGSEVSEAREEKGRAPSNNCEGMPGAEGSRVQGSSHPMWSRMKWSAQGLSYISLAG